MAYQIYKEIFEGERFQKLADKGARPQRVLWASTSTKNPDYSDIKYVEALIGPETINTMPQETLSAYRDHGDPALRLETDLDLAAEVIDKLGVPGFMVSLAYFDSYRSARLPANMVQAQRDYFGAHT